ncbi:MAG: hypothetical protein GY703_03760 [Gammaproteobacteria bacterium]|nr:hypothetical protein [Gammaproteobacteria bacterium]
MSKQKGCPENHQLVQTLKKTVSMFVGILPILAGVLLLTGLLLEYFPVESAAGWFGNNDILDALTGTVFGSVAAGHPLTGYVLGGELLANGISLVAVTALLVSWVTVGSVQFPAEALMLGRRFALYRNLLCFGFSILIAILTTATLQLLG